MTWTRAYKQQRPKTEDERFFERSSPSSFQSAVSKKNEEKRTHVIAHSNCCIKAQMILNFGEEQTTSDNNAGAETSNVKADARTAPYLTS